MVTFKVVCLLGCPKYFPKYLSGRNTFKGSSKQSDYAQIIKTWFSDLNDVTDYFAMFWKKVFMLYYV